MLRRESALPDAGDRLKLFQNLGVTLRKRLAIGGAEVAFEERGVWYAYRRDVATRTDDD